MTHVFVVNDWTFRYHLEYLFAGTCASADALFLEDAQYHNPRKKEDGLTAKQELTIAGMIADVSRIRPGDKILFYLTQSALHEGMFFGVFRVKEKPFFDSDRGNYLSDELGVKLHFRVLIEPDQVFAFGVSEHDALDSLEEITHPSQMCWSMIYRKLKGKRGCTMVTEYESQRLIRLLRRQNKDAALIGKSFTFNCRENHIEATNERRFYAGTKSSLDLKERILVKASRRLAYEAHLQAFVLQNCDKSPLRELTAQFPDAPLWIGNEVSCGVGMQSIDVMLSQETADAVYFKIIELKCVEPYALIVTHQLPWYTACVRDYLVPLCDKPVSITPTILAPKIQNAAQLQAFRNTCSAFGSGVNGNCTIRPISYIGYTVFDDIVFEKVF